MNYDKKYELVYLFNIPMLYTSDRISDDEYSGHLLKYELRRNPSDSAMPVLCSTWVFSDYYGAVLSSKPLSGEKTSQGKFYRNIEPKDFEKTGKKISVREYLIAFSNKEEMEK